MKFFDVFAETSVARNRLPHWQQVAATYFITYRLADSIPRELSDEWNKKRDEWLLDHPQPWDEVTEKEYHEVFSSEFDIMMDRGYGSCVLRQSSMREILADSFGKFDGDRYVMHSWVAMPNHVHVLFTASSGRLSEATVGSWKSFTARLINAELGKSGALWQKDYFDRIIRDWSHFFRVARYIRNNPRKASLGAADYTLWESDFVKRMVG